MATTFTFGDGDFITPNVTSDFFKQDQLCVVKKIISIFSELHNNTYPLKHRAFYKESVSIHTHCRCNAYRRRCKSEGFNCDTNTMLVEVFKKLDSECLCEPRANQLRGDAREEVKNQPITACGKRTD